MSGTNNNYRFQFKKLSTKIDTVLSQLIKIKRVANKNNIILKHMTQQPKFVFDTIPHLTEVITSNDTNVHYDCEDMRNHEEFV